MNNVLTVQPKSPFLIEIVKGLSKRRKAIVKGSNWSLQCERILQEIDGEYCELLEIGCSYGYSSIEPEIAIWVYENGWMKIKGRRTRKVGIDWKWEEEGRFFAANPGKTFINALEKTLKVSTAPKSQVLLGLPQIWLPLLAKGPQEVQ